MISGIDIEDRHGVVEVLLGTLAGEPTVACELAYVEHTGQRVTVEQTAEGTFHVFHDDGTPAIPPHVGLGLSVHDLFRLTYVDGNRLGIPACGSEPRELMEARAALAALTDQLEAAKVARDAADALRLELLNLDEQIRQVEIGRPRRRYARLVLDLEALKAERAAVTSSPDAAQSDRVMAAHLAQLRPLAAQWRATVRRLSDERQIFGERPRLDHNTLAGALSIPDRVPADLDALVEELSAAEARRITLSAKLAGMLARHIDSPSHPDVARLARADQDELWDTCARAVATARRVEQESLRAGGLVTDENAPAPEAVREIESAHEAVEAAQGVVVKRRVGRIAAGGAAAIGAAALPLAPLVAPLALAGSAAAAYWSVLAPRQQLAEAQVWESEALGRAGVPSYLSFHLRRLNAMQDPVVRHRLETAARAHRKAMHHWRLLAGDLSPAEAVDLEHEVRAYAASLDRLDDLGDEVADTRRRLVEEIEPLVEKAREALLDACRPFGVENATLAADLVRQLAQVARIARIQQRLEEAEAEETEARLLVESALQQVGYVEGDLAGRLMAFDEVATAAEQRVRDRERARDADELDREIARLEEAVQAEWRTDYGSSFVAADAREPDPEELASRREMTAMAFHTANRLVPDISLIKDRRAAVERRVLVLEVQSDDEGVPSSEKIAEIERELQHRLAALRHCGRDGEQLPLLLDDCFLNLRADAKWQMLDLVDRLAAHAQLIYLTADPDVTTWARRRAATGSISFQEPHPLGVS
ncbi:MAG TPA: hypothetical protein VHN98_02100 [Acidimicrobiales bacterium]|nr:hypothetical protein [Acidimicrobiales bacterium]